MKTIKGSIESILVKNFDNDKYQWTTADKELNDFIDKEIEKARQQERERIIEVADKLRDNTIQDYPRAYFQEGYNQAIDKIIKTLKN